MDHAVACPFDNDYFIMSVCDMDSLDMEGWCEYSVDTYDDMKTCVMDLVSRNCAKVKIGDQVWPYKFTATRKHGGPWGDDRSVC